MAWGCHPSHSSFYALQSTAEFNQALVRGGQKDRETLTGKVTGSGPERSGPSGATSWCVTWTSHLIPRSIYCLIGNMGKYWNIPHRPALNKWGYEHEVTVGQSSCLFFFCTETTEITALSPRRGRLSLLSPWGGQSLSTILPTPDGSLCTEGCGEISHSDSVKYLYDENYCLRFYKMKGVRGRKLMGQELC